MNIEQALIFLRDCLESHKATMKHLENPVAEQLVSWRIAVGDEKFHSECINGYLQVIALLESLRRD